MTTSKSTQILVRGGLWSVACCLYKVSHLPFDRSKVWRRVCSIFTKEMWSMATSNQYKTSSDPQLKLMVPSSTHSNILVHDDGHPLLCDFGRSKILTHRGFTTKPAGACRYQSPECLKGDSSDPEKAIDVYAFAPTSYEVWLNPCCPFTLSERYRFGLAANPFMIPTMHSS